jgi:HK97 family phage portal protein
MGLIARTMAAGASPALNDGYWGGGSRYTTDGSSLSPGDDAMGIPAFYDGVALISEDIAKMPVHIYEDLGSAGRRPTANMPLEDLLQYQPNAHQSAFDFWEMMVAFAILRKFGVAEIIPGARGPVDQLVPLDPDLVTPRGSAYAYRDPKDGGRERVLLADEVFVVHGRLGRSVLDFASRSLSVDAAIERHAGTLFSRGARPQSVVRHAAELSQKGRDNLRKVLDEYSIGGPRSGRPMLLEEGMTWESVGMTNKDAEFTANRQWGVRQVARWLRLPPHKLADLADANYSNVEQENINYVTDTLLSWTVRIEQAIRRDLIIAKGRYFAKFNLDSLLRGDFGARAQAYSLGIQWGWITRNEVRAREDMNPIPGLDSPLTPLNMTTGTAPGTASAADLSPQATAHLRLLASDAANRIVTREREAVAKAADHSRGNTRSFAADVDAFYAGFGPHVASCLHLPADVAKSWAAEQRASVISGAVPDADWAADSVARLTSLAMSTALGAAA